MTYNVFGGMFNLAVSIYPSRLASCILFFFFVFFAVSSLNKGLYINNSHAVCVYCTCRSYLQSSLQCGVICRLIGFNARARSSSSYRCSKVNIVIDIFFSILG